MPIYEYRCKSCGHDVEALQKVSDPPLKKCPDCGKRTLTRLMSAPSFRLKGGGWYETDFKSDNEKKRNLVDSGDGGKEAAKDGGDSGDSGSSGKEKEAASAKDGAKETTKTTLIPKKTKAPAPKGVTKVAAKASGKAKTAKRAAGTAKKPARAAAR